ncbi:MAG TPA: SAM-dependent methyltransferase [Methylocella sp.]|nr:SAM-dependent methyltransferase [Methylocella sp.]
MSALRTLIEEMIIENGPISIETFMNLALHHPSHGYYTGKQPLGRGGDFTTAPEISQMFGELIGLWCVAVWQAMGAPSPCLLVELGPGRATLMADALRATRRVPAFLPSLDLHLVETNALLRAAQAARLAAAGLAPGWHSRVETLPDGPAVIIANEFFDCLPVRQFVRGRDGWHERLVGLHAKGGLCFGLAPDCQAGLAGSGEDGDVREISLAAVGLMQRLAARLVAQGGVLLIIDYGYEGPGRGETLQAVRGHRYADPLAEPGEADLTAHVDFAALAAAARGAGAKVHGPVPQGIWLARLGIFERAAALRRGASAEQGAAIDAALKRLVDMGRAEGMGRLFKALAVAAPGLPIPPAFASSAHE